MSAARPRTLTAAAAPVFMGTALAFWYGNAKALPALAALVGAVLIQVATNLVNDVADFERGGDTERRVGPMRVTQAGLLSPAQVKRGATVAFALALVVGVYLVSVGGWPILVVGIVSILAGWAYTAGPFPLAYNGLGDLFVFVFFGPVAVIGTYWVQALEVRPDLLLAGVAAGALNTAILAANNLRDLDTDRAAGKRTLPVLFGRMAGRFEYTLLVSMAALALPTGVVAYQWSMGVLAALLACLTLAAPLFTVLREDQAERLRPVLPATARSVGLYGLLFSVGLVLGAL